MRTLKRTLSIVLAIAMVLTTFGMVTVSAANYADTPGHWAEAVIDEWTGYGVIQGDGGYFRPDDAITRAEVAQVTQNVIGYAATTANTFTDVDPNAWYTDAILRLAEAGTLKGNGDGTMTPEAYMTREEAMTMLGRAYGLTPANTNAGITQYADYQSISEYANGYIGTMTAAGYVNGYEDGTIRPQATVSRAEFVKILDNMIGLYIAAPGTYGPAYVKGLVMVKSGGVNLNGIVASGVVISPSAGGQLTLTNSQVDNNIYNMSSTMTVNSVGSNTTTSGSSGSTIYGGPMGSSNYRTYTVTFYVDGRTYHNVSVRYNNYLTSLPTDPVKTGYTFVGWYTSANYAAQAGTTGIFDFGTTRITGNTSVYAGFTADSDATPDPNATAAPTADPNATAAPTATPSVSIKDPTQEYNPETPADVKAELVPADGEDVTVSGVVWEGTNEAGQSVTLTEGKDYVIEGNNVVFKEEFLNSLYDGTHKVVIETSGGAVQFDIVVNGSSIPVPTVAPATEAPSTEAPSTEAPATEAPATEVPSTEAPATEAPATEAPATEAPATEAPATEAPATEAPATEAPATEAPATDAPATDAPATVAPATEAPAPPTPGTNYYKAGLYVNGGTATLEGNGIKTDATAQAAVDETYTPGEVTNGQEYPAPYAGWVAGDDGSANGAGATTEYEGKFAIQVTSKNAYYNIDANKADVEGLGGHTMADVAEAKGKLTLTVDHYLDPAVERNFRIYLENAKATATSTGNNDTEAIAAEVVNNAGNNINYGPGLDVGRASGAEGGTLFPYTAITSAQWVTYEIVVDYSAAPEELITVTATAADGTELGTQKMGARTNLDSVVTQIRLVATAATPSFANISIKAEINAPETTDVPETTGAPEATDAPATDAPAPTDEPEASPSAVYEILEGSTVKVNATPATEGEVASVTVKTVDGYDIPVIDNTFTMPSQDINVNVSFAPATGELPPDEAWTTANEELDKIVLAAGGEAGDNGKPFEYTDEHGDVLHGYSNWTSQSNNLKYTHTNGVTYTFDHGWRAGSGSTTNRCFYFTPKQACIVTVAYTAQSGRPMKIEQNGKVMASGEEGKNGDAPAIITADIEDPTAGDVYVVGGSSNKELYGIFVDYYDPTVLTYRNVSGKIDYTGTSDTSGLKLVFTSTKGDFTASVPFGANYSVDLLQNRSYDISIVDAEGNPSEGVALTLDTNSVDVAKMDITYDLKAVDIGLTDVTGEVVVNEVKNDSQTLDLSKVALKFTAKDDANLIFEVPAGGIVDNKYKLTMMPNHEYEVTAEGIDGYTLSALSGSYLMAAGDMAPFKNILIKENIGEVAFAPTIQVGSDKECNTLRDAIEIIKAMKDRPAGEAGRVTVEIDPGTYIEQVIVDPGYVTFKAADETQKPVITWHYGIGYQYYSADGSYYDEDLAVQKTKKGNVTRWGSVLRVVGSNFIGENIIFVNSFSCEVTEAELADGVEPGVYSDVSGKPDRTVEGYDPKTKNAVERAAAFAGDGTNYELYNCEFISSQDTLYTGNNGYFKNCYIEGGTDYIFGGNSIVFDGCTLAWHGYSDAENGGYITACQTSDVPKAGTPNLVSNGYLLTNCTVANSKYYPNNKFVAGGWGRNWGGAKCQVVFDGITIADGAKVPDGWTKMGGELKDSIVYVNDVKMADGTAVDSSGEKFNPNGTMAANGYEIMDPTDYFGTGWIPVHYDGEIPELDEYTTTWELGEKTSGTKYKINGEGTIIGTTNKPNATDADKTLTVNGSLDNTGRNNGEGDQWANVTEGTTFTIPVVNGSKITFNAYETEISKLNFGNKTITDAETYTYYGTDTTVTATEIGGRYISQIQVVSPANPSTEIPTPVPETTVNVTINGLDAADASAVKLVGNISSVSKVIDIADGKFSVTLEQGAKLEISGIYGGASAYTIDKNEISSTDTDPVITATKVVAAPKAGEVSYDFAKTELPMITSPTWDNFVTKDGIVTLKKAAWHDSQHGISGNADTKISIKVPEGNTTISFGVCCYGNAGKFVLPGSVTIAEGSTDDSIWLLDTGKEDTSKDGHTQSFTYSGDATELEFGFTNQSVYCHGITVTTTAE